MEYTALARRKFCLVPAAQGAFRVSAGDGATLLRAYLP